MLNKKATPGGSSGNKVKYFRYNTDSEEITGDFNKMRLSIKAPKNACFISKIVNNKIGITISRGGFRGIAHWGILQYLQELNIQLLPISGASTEN